MKFVRKLNLDSVKRYCILCNSLDYLNFKVTDNLGFTNTYSVCLECGLCFMNPMYTEESYSKYYNGLYEKFYGIKGIGDISKGCKGDLIGSFIKENIPKAKSVYELGCGSGANIAALKSLHNFHVSGSDPSQESCFSAKKLYNLNIKNKGISYLLKKDINNFDVICLLDVIEHFFNPLDSLKKIYSLLNSGKYLIIETLALEIKYPPKGLRGYFRIPHPYNFTINTLKNLIIKSKFEIIKSEILGYGMIRVLCKKNSKFKSNGKFKSRNNVSICLRSLKKKETEFLIYKIKTFPFRILFLIYNIFLSKFLKINQKKIHNGKFFNFLRLKQIYWQ
tara:strand:+ start:17866 stop:18867 length:1002 start_codon:yes stop_codon:yes gene_type:complete